MLLRLSTIAFLLAAGAPCFAGASANEKARDGSRYSVTSLGVLQGGSSIPRGLNINGDVVGTSGEVHGAFFHAFVWTKVSGMKTVGELPGGESSDAFAVNREGYVVGSANNTRAIRAFLWKSETGMADLGALPGDVASKALAINDAGEIVGSSSGPRGIRAFIWTKTGGMRVLPLPAQRFVEATGVNNSGQIAGVVENSGSRHAFFWCQEKGFRDLGVLSGDEASQASALNDAGQVVGTSVGAQGTHAFRWSSATGVEPLIASPPGASSGASGVNNFGQIVGFSESKGQSRAVIWINRGTALDLNQLIPASAEVVLTSALAINDRGQIIATGMPKSAMAHDQGHQHAGPGTAYLLTPAESTRAGGLPAAR